MGHFQLWQNHNVSFPPKEEGDMTSHRQQNQEGAEVGIQMKNSTAEPCKLGDKTGNITCRACWMRQPFLLLFLIENKFTDSLAARYG